MYLSLSPMSLKLPRDPPPTLDFNIARVWEKIRRRCAKKSLGVLRSELGLKRKYGFHQVKSCA